MHALFTTAFVATLSASVAAQAPTSAPAGNGGQSNGQCGISAALVDQKCPWPYSGPAQIDQQASAPRGPQQGTNQCNSSTENQQSQCVNMVVNSISDFCVYSNPKLDLIANGEGETTAYCMNKGYGTRYIPDGTITGIQVIDTPGYIAFGIIGDMTKINVQAGDSGGELDPHGADLRGNPIGALVYSNATGNGYQQIEEWHEFISSSMLCLKICKPGFVDPSGNLCENRFDTQGCAAAVPLNYNAINGTFQSCKGDNQQVPNGSVLPIPASSQCTTYTSSVLFKNQAASATPTSSATPSAASASGASGNGASGNNAATSTAPVTSSKNGGAGSSSSSKGSASVSFVAGSGSSGGVILAAAALFIGGAAVLL